jgi:hypothetical protein
MNYFVCPVDDPFWVVDGLMMILAFCQGLLSGFFLFVVFYGEFDPGSGRTLAACLTHASRAERPLWGYSSGERVSIT